mmetsp:Transcript_7354/g.21313  ORF Transcript_7354/g.21313 Transcript_7354/m.21313 type:complete len:243 (-) Transcript_7354:824-1552(-)
MMQTRSPLVQAPMNSTMFSCLSSEMMLISWANSLMYSNSLLKSLLMYLMATTSPLKVPLWIAPKPPWPTFLDSRSLSGSTSQSATEVCWTSSLAFQRLRKEEPLLMPPWPFWAAEAAAAATASGPSSLLSLALLCAPPAPLAALALPPGPPEGAGAPLPTDAASTGKSPLESRENLAWNRLSRAVRCWEVTRPWSCRTNQYRWYPSCVVNPWVSATNSPVVAMVPYTVPSEAGEDPMATVSS